MKPAGFRIGLAMTIAAFVVLSAAHCAHAALPAPGAPGAISDPRYCGEPPRYPNGRIKRSERQKTLFVKQFPCPANLKHVKSCPRWQIDHVLPMAAGGCDTPVNMQWLPTAVKTCKSSACKDRWEGRYHAHPRQPVNP